MPLETVKKLAALPYVERRALKREVLAIFRRAEILARAHTANKQRLRNSMKKAVLPMGSYLPDKSQDISYETLQASTLSDVDEQTQPSKFT